MRVYSPRLGMPRTVVQRSSTLTAEVIRLIEEERNARGWSIARLANEAGVAGAPLKHYLHQNTENAAKRCKTTLEDLDEIAFVLGFNDVESLIIKARGEINHE